MSSTTNIRRSRRIIDRQQTGDESDPAFVAALEGHQPSGSDKNTRSQPRRGVRRQPTGDMELELMMAIENDTEEQAKPPEDPQQGK